jgi:Ser/Thr protein kinase RdoA (MazF antagonist)
MDAAQKSRPGVETAAVAVAEHFALPSAIGRVEPHGAGLINATFLVSSGGDRYILQRINETVFPEPERLMFNLAVLEKHLQQRGDGRPRIPPLIAARDGRPFVLGRDGGVWRLMEFIAGTRTIARIDDPEQAREVGRILGGFHASTGDLPPDRLVETLPGFHVTPNYLARFDRVLDGLGADGRDGIQRESAFLEARRDVAEILETARRDGRTPLRVIHGDPKLDNILFDRTTGRAVSLIDLDTVQPGLVHYDFADCLRSCCNRGGESADGIDGVRFDLDVCRQILSAYAAETRDLLGAAEIGLVFAAIRLMPLELGLRFLTDHLEGDRYFRVTERGQNLRKARVQFALVEDIEKKRRELQSIIADCFQSPPR